jgi:hypothetical protein
MRRFFLACSALASPLVLACNDVSSPTPPAEALAPAFSATVNRFTGDDFFAVLVNESLSLAAVIGLSHDQLPAFCAEENVAFDQFNVLEVTRPDESVKVTLQGSLGLTVYSIVGISDLCELTETTPLATGTARVRYTDNDVSVTLNRTNSFGTSIVGTASGNGGRFHVYSNFRITILPNGVEELRVDKVSITPLGD